MMSPTILTTKLFIPPALPAVLLRPDLDETFETFFYQRISEEMFEYWAIPMFEVMCSYSGEDVSCKAFLAMMIGYMNADSITFKDGVGVLPMTLADRFEVELTSRVKLMESRTTSG
jgi:protoporphyrinogen oxidase